MVVGDPGVGKTALLGVAAERASAGGCRWFGRRGRSSRPTWAIPGSTRHSSPSTTGSNGWASAPRRSPAALGYRAGAPPDRLVVSTAVLALLRRVAEIQPVLLIVDDVQWLDRSTLHVLISWPRAWPAPERG